MDKDLMTVKVEWLIEQASEARDWARRLLRERDELRRKLDEAAQRELAMSERIGELERRLDVPRRLTQAEIDAHYRRIEMYQDTMRKLSGK